MNARLDHHVHNADDRVHQDLDNAQDPSAGLHWRSPGTLLQVTYGVQVEFVKEHLTLTGEDSRLDRAAPRPKPAFR
jgi:hypothetical protein